MHPGTLDHLLPGGGGWGGGAQPFPASVPSAPSPRAAALLWLPGTSHPKESGIASLPVTPSPAPCLGAWSRLGKGRSKAARVARKGAFPNFQARNFEIKSQDKCIPVFNVTIQTSTYQCTRKACFVSLVKNTCKRILCMAEMQLLHSEAPHTVNFYG